MQRFRRHPVSNRVNPGLLNDLKAFGLNEAHMCYNCGTCTAVCNLSTPENSFPRKLVRYVQLGLEDKILHSPDPWLCYYCGDCSTHCPRGAEPGETVMALRRYLTSIYDWTGFARRFYTSKAFEFGALFTVAILVGLGLIFINTGKPDLEHASLNSLWPAHGIEAADLGMAAILSTFLISNIFRCFKYVMGDLAFKIPIGTYLSEIKVLLINFLTQKRFGLCTDRKQWFIHLFIMTGYSSIFLMIVVGIRWFQRDHVDYSFWNPMVWVGYYATFGILYGTSYALIGRIKKSKPVYRSSHSTDWVFLVLLQLTTFTGILIHFSILLDLPRTTYAIYVIHLMIAVPMLVLEVPFAKWAHLAYRPVVLFLLKVQERYGAERAGIVPAAAPFAK